MKTKLGLLVLLAALFAAAGAAAQEGAPVERWGSKELALAGPREGNPFLEVELSATFRQGTRAQTVDGFYDGDGQYKLRFMPDASGEWEYQTHSNRPALDGRRGKFTVVAAKAGNLAFSVPGIAPGVGAPIPWTSRFKTTSGVPLPLPASGCRDGKFTRSPPPLTEA